MFTRSIQTDPGALKQSIDPLDDYMSNALQVKPSMLHSAAMNFSKAFLTIPTLATDIESNIYGRRTDTNVALHDTLNTFNREIDNVDSWTQETTDFLASLAGQAVSVAPLAAEEAAGTLVNFATTKAAKFAPLFFEAALKKEMTKLTLRGIEKETFSQFGTRSLQLGAQFSGFMAAEDIEHSYDEETNKFNLDKAAISIGINGALGALIPSAQFLAGTLWKRIRGAEVESKVPYPGKDTEKVFSEIDNAVADNRLTPKQADLLKEYHENPNDPKIKEAASQALLDEGHNVNTTNNKVLVNLLEQNDVKNIENVIMDQLTKSPTEDQLALSDFVIHGRIDGLRNVKKLGDGLQGWLDYIEEHLKEMPERLAKLDESVFNGIKENMEFSQSSIDKVIKKLGREESHVSQLPFTLPDNILKRISTLDKIKELEFRMKERQRSNNGIPDKKTQKRIESLRKNIPEVQSPKEELLSIKDDLVKDNKLVEDYKGKKTYHRLSELAHIWPQARNLLDRIHLEDSHHTQAAFKNILESFNKLINSNLSRLANPERVANYLKSKLNTTLDRSEKPVAVVKPIEVKNLKEEKLNEILDQQKEQIKSMDYQETKSDFSGAERKLTQFSKAAEALKNLISCSLGVRNGQI